MPDKKFMMQVKKSMMLVEKFIINLVVIGVKNDKINFLYILIIPLNLFI
jgi:hypothetical protein